MPISACFPENEIMKTGETASDSKKRNVTNRIIDVTERFLQFFMPFGIFETAVRRNRKDIKNGKEQNKKIYTGNNAHRGICCLDRIDTDH